MKKNMGSLDRGLRVAVAVVVGALIATGTITAPLSYALGTLAVIFLATSVVSFCPLYLPFGLSTCQTNNDSAE